MLHRGSGMNSWLRRIASAAALFAGVGAVGRIAASPAAPSKSSPAAAPVTFNRDIAPIIFRSCSTCHRPGEAAPFPLLNYSDVKKHARQIVDVTRSRSMPPWLPDVQPLKFRDEMRLSDAEIGMLQRWVEQGEV